MNRYKIEDGKLFLSVPSWSTFSLIENCDSDGNTTIIYAVSYNFLGGLGCVKLGDWFDWGNKVPVHLGLTQSELKLINDPYFIDVFADSPN